MNREIKFRVWDKELKTYNSPSGHHLVKQDGVLSVALNLDIVKVCGTDRFVIEDYTGCKDKNGKDIFEGDIIKAYSEEFENENFTGKVIFDEGSFLTWINKNDIRGVWSGDNIEVVGNLFENPELLNI